jgi:berberine-like enzyme
VPVVDLLNLGGPSRKARDRIRAACQVISYGESKYRRLAQLKARYDPTDVFRMNQNIVPPQGQTAD